MASKQIKNDLLYEKIGHKMGLPKAFYEKMIFGYFKPKINILIVSHLRKGIFLVVLILQQTFSMFIGVPSVFGAKMLYHQICTLL